MIQTILYDGKPVEEASKALIFLHGRGGIAQDTLKFSLSLAGTDTHIIAPQAINNSWYPQGFMVDETLNEPSLSSSIKEIYKIVEELSQHLPLDKIYLGGFSQGACLSLEISAKFAKRYGGIIAFTGGLIGPEIDENKYKGQFEGTPIFISNGDNDPHIPLSRSQESKELLEKLGAQVTMQIFPGRFHTVSKEEIRWVKDHFFGKN